MKSIKYLQSCKDKRRDCLVERQKDIQVYTFKDRASSFLRPARAARETTIGLKRMQRRIKKYSKV